jgi:hypothetical protein
MEHSPARVQFRRCYHLRRCGLTRLGNTTRTGGWNSFRDGRTLYMGALRFSNLCRLSCFEFDVGRIHPRPKGMAKWHVVAIDNSDVAGCGGNRFRAPLTRTATKVAPQTTAHLSNWRNIALTQAIQLSSLATALQPRRIRPRRGQHI